jgi:hypothetical protein
MRRVSAGCILAVVALTSLLAAPVFAQSTDYTATSSLGVMGNLAIPVFGGFQVVGDVGLNHKNESGAGVNVGTITGGVRYVIGVEPTGTIKPFVEGLAGVGVVNAPGYGTHKGFAWGAGAGVDVMALRWAGLRLQVDYFHAQMESGGPTVSEVRFGIGLCLGGRIKAAGGWAPARLTASSTRAE